MFIILMTFKMPGGLLAAEQDTATACKLHLR